ncbi:MAG: SLC13 family permease [Candidatus Marinimicrobia bacterium]|nr:SLC13 family permease [Candidatus Neomarinimicrobiota bacterium]|tara:strand:+ start:816 stop:2603 length:1788 start_codon:yes stop_codon:yes gene_type:complete
MISDPIIFLFIIVLALVLFVKEVFPLDVTALALLVILLFAGFLTLDEAISGFSNKAVLTVALMFILSSSLVKTGFVEVMAEQLSILGGNKWVSISLFLITTSFVSAFINNTAAVAIFIPLALNLSRRFQISPSKILIPLSYAGIYGGTMTLIGTSTNLLVSSMAEEYGIIPFTMFEFFKMGVVFFFIGTIYNLIITPKLLPSRVGISSLTRSYHMSPYLTELKIDAKSPLVGSTLLHRQISLKYDVTVLVIIRENVRFEQNLRNFILQKDDVLLVRGTLDNFMTFRDEEKLLLLTDMKMNQSELTGEENTVVEGLVTQNSQLIGMTLKELNFRKSFSAFVLAVRREGRTLREKIARIRLHFGDTLLIFLPKDHIGNMLNNPDLAILQEHKVQLHKVRLWWLSVAVIPIMMITAAFGWIDILQAALLAVVLLLIVNSITIQEAYRSINWSVVILIAAFVPVGIAMERSGTASYLASIIVQVGNYFSSETAPHVVLSLFFLFAIILTALMSNSTAAIVLVPVALAVSQTLDVEPRSFLFAVCFGASTSFMTPMGYQTNLMVYGPGRYRFSDFMKAGAPLNIIFWILGTFFIPIFWPF